MSPCRRVVLLAAVYATSVCSSRLGAGHNNTVTLVQAQVPASFDVPAVAEPAVVEHVDGAADFAGDKTAAAGAACANIGLCGVVAVDIVGDAGGLVKSVESPDSSGPPPGWRGPTS